MKDDQWEEMRARRAQLDARVKVAPRVTIEGVSDAIGMAALKFEGDQQWTLQLTLEAWRLVGGTLQDRPLSLKRQATEADVKLYKHTLRPFGRYRMQVRLLMDEDLPMPEALLEALPLDIEDPDLEQWARQLQLPITYEDELFGTCVLDKRIRLFKADVHWSGTRAYLYLHADSIDTLQPVLKCAYELWNSAVNWRLRVFDRAVADLLDLKNSTWLGKDEDPVSADEFRQRLSLQSISVDKDGRLEFCCTDGDLFFGHSILVPGSLEQGLTTAYIAG
ncbi:DUF2262 domain-containing protein [Paraburkholderia sabiae]|uniref:DUF2262 domain-containing protein n=1 Tax=Paraburkholderia sabiae TaxID=273251 RepID=A0ABU9QL19_9BURK|nr:DUF2262 domain-containing protein [Paraburkholderia sabiae]WJZ77395.1 DUF2262 domain-containing protein [Paraburkholderia sabiae]CAD6547441.1 hypothetical protein LMG24235_04421 [Paraburkholderia sabiae]